MDIFAFIILYIALPTACSVLGAAIYDAIKKKLKR